MAARIERLISRSAALRRERAAELRELVLSFEDQEPLIARQILAVIDRHTVAERGWTFVMLSPAQNLAVTEWILAHAARPKLSARLWATCFVHMRMDTGEIALSRADMARTVGASTQHVSTALGELEGIGALIRRQEGRTVRWLMNPTVATCLTGLARESAQRQAPDLRLVAEV